MHIAVVEDEINDFNEIADCLSRYAKSCGCGVEFSVIHFQSALDFLDRYTPVYDAVFMDIQLPDIDGMDAAARLREKDISVPLVFITNMSNCAVRGYSVGAFDFIVKPIAYFGFAAVIARLLRFLDESNDSREMTIKTTSGVKRVRISSIYRVDVFDHKLEYSTDSGKIESWGKLKEAEERLSAFGFSRPNNYCLVNLKRVKEVNLDYILIKEERIEISRSRKKALIKAFMDYCGKKI